MSIVALKKLSLCGLIKEKQAVLATLQDKGIAHLISFQKSSQKQQEQALPEGMAQALTALAYLQQCEIKRHQVQHVNNFDFNAIISEILKLKENLAELHEQREFLKARIKDVALWGEFSLPKPYELAGYHLWFYIVPKREMKKVYVSDLIWQRVNQSNTKAYIVVLSKDEPPKKSMPVPRTHMGNISLSKLQQQLETLELAIEDVCAERTSLTRWISLIVSNLAAFSHRSELEHACTITRDESELFIVQLWVAEYNLNVIDDLINQHKLAWLVESPDGVEQPPTLLKNTQTFAGGEDVVKFYQIPNYYGWDPSIIVFCSFALFFAMILSDAGYAMIFLGVLLFKWRNLGASKKGIRFRMLLLVTLIISLFWGILAGSYFGVSPEPNSIMASLKVIDMNDFDLMMKLSIFVGVAHIALANMIKAYQLKAAITRFSAIAWALVAIGGFMLWFSLENKGSWLMFLAYALLGIAGLLLLCFSSERQVKTPFDGLLRIFDGIRNLSNVTKIFGDVLSYMRLFALGLASASLAVTFNQLAVQVYDAIPGMGLLLSILLLIIGHSLNIMLGIMSGVVHGLRLNFIEFYNWSVSDEGYPFNVFSKKEEF